MQPALVCVVAGYAVKAPMKVFSGTQRPTRAMEFHLRGFWSDLASAIPARPRPGRAGEAVFASKRGRSGVKSMPKTGWRSTNGRWTARKLTGKRRSISYSPIVFALEPVGGVLVFPRHS